MIRKKISRIYLLIWMWLSISVTFLKADNLNTLHQINCFSMETLEDSTLWEGLAGTFFGKQENRFIMAGGSAFPGGKPWQDGIKHFSDQVFVFEQLPDGSFSKVYQGNDLPVPLAEGSYATLPGGLLCVGGLTPDGITGKSWLLAYSGSGITVTEYPSLPVPVKNSTATVIGSKVYLVGGELADGTSTDQFLVLDLSNPTKGWEKLPNFPVPVSGATLTSQQDGKRWLSSLLAEGPEELPEKPQFFMHLFTISDLHSTGGPKKEISSTMRTLQFLWQWLPPQLWAVHMCCSTAVILAIFLTR